MLLSVNEYYFTNVDSFSSRELPAWAKLEKYYNCEDFFDSLKCKVNKLKKTKSNR